MQDRPKQQIAAVRTFTIGTLKYLKTQAITHRVGDPTPIICEITPRIEQALYREGIRIQSLAGFFRLHDKRFQATGHKAQKIRVTGYLLWDDDHNGSADVGSTVEYFSKNGFHHPWRSTAWEIHPVMKIEVIE